MDLDDDLGPVGKQGRVVSFEQQSWLRPPLTSTHCADAVVATQAVPEHLVRTRLVVEAHELGDEASEGEAAGSTAVLEAIFSRLGHHDGHVVAAEDIRVRGERGIVVCPADAGAEELVRRSFEESEPRRTPSGPDTAHSAPAAHLAQL